MKNQTHKKHFPRRIAIGAAFTAIVLVAVGAVLAWRLFFRYQPEARPVAVLHGEADFGYIPEGDALEDVSVRAPQAFVYDCERGEILFQKGAERVLYPASTTKLLTILCALEYLAPEELVTPGEELSLVKPGSSLAQINRTHTVTVECLVEAMLLPSGNDAAYALAAAAGRKISGGDADGVRAVAVFMDAMREYADGLGLIGTTFTTPDGYAKEEHYSTLEDMILICRAATENELIRRYAARPEDDVVYASGHTNHWENTNRLVKPGDAYYRPEVTGLKTGSLTHNYCLICTAEKAGYSYIIGLFSEWTGEDRFIDAVTLLDALSGDGEE